MTRKSIRFSEKIMRREEMETQSMDSLKVDRSQVPDFDAAPDHRALVDPFGRHISYLRVSVTDRCDFRCVYCMAEDRTFLQRPRF